MPKNTTRLAGIISVGGSHAQAIENFRLTATGQNAMFYRAEDGNVYASQSGVDLYDPQGKETLLSEDAELVSQAEFQSESSSGNVKAEYHICLDGCNSHIVSDSSAHVTHCPSCSASLEEITDERITDYLENENGEQSVSRSSIVAVGKTVSDAKINLANAIRNSNAVTALSSATTFVAAQDNVRFDPYSALAVSSTQPLTEEEVASVSANGDKIEAHVYSCSASCALPFTIATDDDTVFCAHCSSPLLEIEESVSSDEDDDASDILDEEEMEDEEEDDDDFDGDDEDLDDEESESSTSSDDEEEEEEEEEDDFEDDELNEDDFDDEEEDEEDDFDDEEEEDEEEDDTDFDSESSVRSLSNSNPELDAPVRSFDSLSAVVAENETLNPSLVSLSRSQSGTVPTVFMFYDGQPIARATFSSVSAATSEDAARRSFDTDHFIKAVSASLRNSGVQETCTEFGFDPFVMQIAVSKVLSAEADARIEQTTAQVNETISDHAEVHRERFVAALSTSMLGVTKNFWRDSTNPVVESLCATLRNLGIAEPRPIVERAFLNNTQDFLMQALSKADMLMSKSDVSQNEIAEAIADAAGTIRTEVKKENSPKVPVQTHSTATDTLESTIESNSSVKKDDFEARLKRRFG